MDKHLARALVLMEQGRHDLAEPELRKALAAEPDNAMAHANLAGCLCVREQYAQATEEAQTAIRLMPDWPYAHYVLACVYMDRNRLEEAEAAALEALRLDPEDPDHHALLANIYSGRRDWEAMLQAAEEGLALDPEHVRCNNYRALALTKLGRTEEAGATLASTLARDPENAFSHANQGWNYLHQRDTQKALEHFREALRLDPEMDYARAGMVEALKSRHLIYALILRYFLWMSQLSTRAQWAVILGGFFGYTLLGNLAEQHPGWSPWIRPVLIAYIVFVIMTWISVPLFNLLLRLNRFGRHALSRDQTLAANWVGILIVPALGCLVTWLVTDKPLAFLGTIYFGFLLLPISALFHCDRGWPRTCMTLYTVGLAASLPLAFVLSRLAPSLAGVALQLFVLGTVLSGFVANFLMMQTVRH